MLHFKDWVPIGLIFMSVLSSRLSGSQNHLGEPCTVQQTGAPSPARPPHHCLCVQRQRGCGRKRNSLSLWEWPLALKPLCTSQADVVFLFHRLILAVQRAASVFGLLPCRVLFSKEETALQASVSSHTRICRLSVALHVGVCQLCPGVCTRNPGIPRSASPGRCADHVHGTIQVLEGFPRYHF